jgi:chemotaxis protein CheX
MDFVKRFLLNDFADDALVRDFAVESREHLDVIEPDLLTMEQEGEKGMNLEHINCFVESVDTLFTRMLNAKVVRGKPGISKSDPANPRELTSFIGLSGPLRGTVALSFPTNTALAIVNRFLGSELRVIDCTVTDGIAEIVNMVAGSAKAQLMTDAAQPITLSLPAVVRGNSYDVEYPSNTVWLDVPFSSELGSFSMRVTLNAGEMKSQAKAGE